MSIEKKVEAFEDVADNDGDELIEDLRLNDAT